MFPDTIGKGFDEMVKIHGMDDWKPGASALVAVNAGNISLILAEKEAAVREAAALPASSIRTSSAWTRSSRPNCGKCWICMVTTWKVSRTVRAYVI